MFLQMSVMPGTILDGVKTNLLLKGTEVHEVEVELFCSIMLIRI
jgi:hypothetical protein